MSPKAAFILGLVLSAYMGEAAIVSEVAQLHASDPEGFDYFGTSIAVEGDLMVVGSPFEDEEGTDAGAAYVFARSGGNWTEVQKLTVPSGDFDGEFGQSVGIALVDPGGSEGVELLEPMIAVGEPLDDEASGNGGAVHTYRKDELGTWVLDQKLLPDPATTNDRIGKFIEMDGEWLFAGGEDVIFVFSWNAASGEWDLEQRLAFSVIDPVLSMDFDGSSLIVGRSAKVDFYRHDGDEWSSYENFAVGVPLDGFGRAVAIDGNLAAVGAPGSMVDGLPQGVVYVYRRLDIDTWEEEASFDFGEEQFVLSVRDFGRGLALHRNRLFVGAPNATTDLAFRFQRNAAGAWAKIDTYNLSDPS
ncbi:MAG: hypothetical protein AAGB46_10645, partial [Verrucomicrobiota bacterium]